MMTLNLLKCFQQNVAFGCITVKRSVYSIVEVMIPRLNKANAISENKTHMGSVHGSMNFQLNAGLFCLNRHVIMRPLRWVGCFGLGPCLCLCSARQIMFRHAVLLMSTEEVFMASSDYRHTSLPSTRCSVLNHR